MTYQARGERSGTAKLTEAAVSAIRAAHATGCFTYADLGRKYNITGEAISNVVNRQTWRHI